MEDKEQNPFQINSFNPFDLCKKRKMLAERLCLPSPKHKHCSEGFSSKSSLLVDGGLPRAEPMDVQFTKGNTLVMCFDEGSMPESVSNSNSFSKESDSATSVFRGTKVEFNQAITCTYDCSSTLSLSFGGAWSDSSGFSVESSTSMEPSSTKQEAAFASGEYRLETVHKLQEHLLELGYEDYDCGENISDDTEQCTYQELEDLYDSSRLHPNPYILSSEVQTRVTTPTIDQEFEQYFSTLML